MTKLKTLAMTAVAAAPIGVGGLATAPSASAAPRSCEQAVQLAGAYYALGEVWFAIRNTPMGNYWYKQGDRVIAAACFS